MLTVFNLQWLRLKRDPTLMIIFIILTLAFVFFIVGSQGEQLVRVQTFSDDLSEAEMEVWLDRLNETPAYQFEKQDRESVERDIQMSQINFALELSEENYRYLVGQDSQLLAAINQHVEKVYQTHLRINEVEDQYPDSTVDQQNYIQVKTESLGGLSQAEEGSAHVISGMTLYFSMYTILFSLMNIAVEKRTGTWDRLISSPLKKRGIYIGQLLHYFAIGILQIGLCFLIINQWFNYDFGSQYLAIVGSVMAFVFAAVALGMLVIAIVNSPQQLQAVIPIVATGMAMVGGAFWPLEIISNNILLTMAKITPIYYGMEALKGAILYERPITELLGPISFLLLMGVLFMGIGLNLMEGRK